MEFLVLFNSQTIGTRSPIECNCYLGEVRDCDHMCAINGCTENDATEGRGLKARKQQERGIKRNLIP